MARIIDDKFLDIISNNGADAVRHLSGAFRRCAPGSIADVKIVQANHVRPHPHLIVLRKIPPGAIGFEDHTLTIQNGDMGG
jgi:hypothetical protein